LKYLSDEVYAREIEIHEKCRFIISVVQRVEKIPPEREGMNQTLCNCNTYPKKGIVQIPY